jgi:hypothetical protein
LLLVNREPNALPLNLGAYLSDTLREAHEFALLVDVACRNTLTWFQVAYVPRELPLTAIGNSKGTCNERQNANAGLDFHNSNILFDIAATGRSGAL